MPTRTAESLVELPFPARGIDLSPGFGAQTLLTTPVGVNVRTYEALTARARGGSRPGLSRYINQQLPLNFVSGSHLIQHLNLIVDPSGIAGLDQFDPGAGGIADPSDPGPPEEWWIDPATGLPSGGRISGLPIRDGGWGVMPHKRKVRPRKGGPIQFMQSTAQGFAPTLVGGIGTASLDYPVDVTVNDLLVVCVTKNSGNGNGGTVSDSRGNTWATATFNTSGGGSGAVIYYAISKDTGPMTVTVTWTNSPKAAVGVLEYKNVLGNPLDGKSSNAANSTALSTGSINIGVGSELAIGVFAQASQNAIAFSTPFNLRIAQTNANAFQDMYVIDNLITPKPSITLTGTSNLVTVWWGIGVSFLDP